MSFTILELLIAIHMLHSVFVFAKVKYVSASYFNTLIMLEINMSKVAMFLSEVHT